MDEKDVREDVILPEDWTYGEDIFAETEHNADGLTEAVSEEPRNEEETTPEQPETAEPERKTYRLRVNHEDREVSLTEEEVAARLQKSYAFDALKERGKVEDLERLEPETQQEQAQTETQTTERDFRAEVDEAKTLFPDFREMPEEVAVAVAHGVSLTTALSAFRAKQARTEAAQLKMENQILRQNERSRERAPVTGVTGYYADQRPKDDFLSGLDADW